MEKKLPKYIKGQFVVIRSIEELRAMNYKEDVLDFVRPLAGQVVMIENVSKSADSYFYIVRKDKENYSVMVHEDFILYDANQRSNVEHFESIDVSGSIVASDVEMAKLDTSKLNPSPMQVWKEMFLGVKSFLSSASPELRAFASGQLLGLSEQLMSCSSPVIRAENKENCDSTVYIALAEDVEKYPKYVVGENFLSGSFELKEGKSFIGYRFYKWNVVFHSVYLGLTPYNKMKGFTVTMKMYVGNYPKSFLKDIFNRFLGKDVVVLFKEDSLPYYRCLYRRSGKFAILDYQENGKDPSCFSVTVSPIESPDMLLEEKDFPIE